MALKSLFFLIRYRIGSDCRRGGLLYESANPPRKIVDCDASGPAADCLRPTIVHVAEPAGQREKPAEPAKSRRCCCQRRAAVEVFHGSFCLPGGAGAHARAPATLAPVDTHSIGRTAQDVSAPARRHLKPPIQRILPLPQGESWIIASSLFPKVGARSAHRSQRMGLAHGAAAGIFSYRICGELCLLGALGCCLLVGTWLAIGCNPWKLPASLPACSDTAMKASCASLRVMRALYVYRETHMILASCRVELVDSPEPA